MFVICIPAQIPVGVLPHCESSLYLLQRHFLFVRLEYRTILDREIFQYDESYNNSVAQNIIVMRAKHTFNFVCQIFNLKNDIFNKIFIVAQASCIAA